MEYGLTPTWRSLLDVLMAAEAPLRLRDVAEAFPGDTTMPTLHRNLQAMADAGLVRRQGERKTATYEPRESLQVSWTGHLTAGMGQHNRWIHVPWKSSHRVDWRFPLVGRIPDVPAQQTLLRFLDECFARGMLTPWLMPGVMDEEAVQLEAKFRDEYFTYLRDPKDHYSLTFIVYGSCATGEARADSDVDLLIIGPTERHDDGRDFIREIGFEGLASEMNLGASRPLQVTSYPIDDFRENSPAHFRATIVREGKTVYSTSGHGEFVEAWDHEYWSS